MREERPLVLCEIPAWDEAKSRPAKVRAAEAADGKLRLAIVAVNEWGDELLGEVAINRRALRDLLHSVAAAVLR